MKLLKFKTLLYFFLLSFLSVSVKGQLAWDWVNANKDSFRSAIFDIKYLDSTAIYVTGEFSNEITLGNITLQSKSDADVFIARLDFKGNVKWIKNIGETGVNDGVTVITDDEDMIYISGNWNNHEKTFLAKYNNNGDLIWLKTFDEGYYNDNIIKKESMCFFKNKIAIISRNYLSLFDKNGNKVSELAKFYHTITCDENFIYAVYSGFIYFYNENLEEIMVFEYSSSEGGGSDISSIKVKSDYIYVAGNCESGFIIGDSTYNNNEMFWAKIDKSGQVLKSNHGGGIKAKCYDMVLNNDSDICIAGYYFGGLFDTIQVGNYDGLSEAFVVSYDNLSGKIKTFNYAGSNNWGKALAIDIDKNNNIYSAGIISANYEYVAGFEDLYVDAAPESYYIGKLSKEEINVSISGRINSDGDLVLGNITMYRLEPDSTVVKVYRNATLSNEYKIRISKKGKYYLWVDYNLNSFISTYYKNSFWWKNADYFELTSDSIINDANVSIIKVPNLVGLNSISGNLCDENGVPQSFTNVYLIEGEDSVISYERSDTLGNYIFRNVPDGKYQIYVDKIGLLMDSIYSIDGSQKSTFTNYDYMIDYQSKKIKVSNNSVLGISEFKSDNYNFNIFPNPVTDVIYIDFNEDETILNYQIFNLQGIILLQGKVIDNTINVPDLNKGIYILTLNSKHKFKSKKFCKL